MCGAAGALRAAGVVWLVWVSATGERWWQRGCAVVQDPLLLAQRRDRGNHQGQKTREFFRRTPMPSSRAVVVDPGPPIWLRGERRDD